MKLIKTLTLAAVAILLISACNSKQKQKEQSIDAPTLQEMEKFSKAAEKVANMLQPKSASLIFKLDGTTYKLDTKDIEVSIIPFTMYKPINEEEGETEESSLIWLKGTDATNGANISFSVNLKKKIDNGFSTANGGEVIISKEDKEQYYGVKKMNLNISNLSEKRFRKELSGYSLDMSFSGTIAEYGAEGKTHEIKDGEYTLRY
ncbi:MAG: hypothetical protein LKI39_14245 [Bacteroides sp.]|jgi:hypothetical protein|nr:hypothetical protein [Bacteroides sp.]MCI1683696.1 hypothetical protein [Bacteroides sp.]